MKLIFAICFTCTVSLLFAQNNFQKEISFYKYLADKNELHEAEWVLQSISINYLTKAQLDSLNFEKGWFYYTQKKLDSSNTYLKKVTQQDARFTKATFFCSYNYAHLKQYELAVKTIASVDTANTDIAVLKTFHISGLLLLQRNYKLFDSITAQSKQAIFQTETEQEKFQQLKFSMCHTKPKSVFIAGSLSAMIPSLGKLYCGKKKLGIGSFLPIISMGILTLEAFNKGGINGNTRFWIYGTLFTTFYIGNIVGSIQLAKIVNKQRQNFYDNQILFNLHIPLRNMFN